MLWVHKYVNRCVPMYTELYKLVTFFPAACCSGHRLRTNRRSWVRLMRCLNVCLHEQLFSSRARFAWCYFQDQIITNPICVIYYGATIYHCLCKQALKIYGALGTYIGELGSEMLESVMQNLLLKARPWKKVLQRSANKPFAWLCAKKN
jgi:hypothetical protein